MALETKDTKRYVYVLGSKAEIRENVPEGTPGAVYREYRTSDDKTGSKWELVYKAITGLVKDINFYVGQFGTNIEITLEMEEGDLITLSLLTKSAYGEDVMSRIPNINLDQPVRFTPYLDRKDHGRMSVKQGDTKVESFFVSYDAETKAYTYTNGMPAPKGNTKNYTSEKWTLYFATARDFLMDYITENVLPKYGHTAQENESATEDKPF